LPNWCENKLVVSVTTGTDESKRQLDEFIETAAGFDRFGSFTILDFDAFVPYPKPYAMLDSLCDAYGELYGKAQKLAETLPEEERKELLDGIKSPWEYKDGFNLGGYEWCISNWGTKWNASDAVVDYDELTARYDFLTAWSPPSPVVLAMSKKFPLLYFELDYMEPGVAFKGRFACRNGNVLTDDCWDMTPEDFEELEG